MERFLVVTCLAVTILSSETRNLRCNGQTSSVKCLATDQEALLDFKEGLNDPEKTLSSWRGMDCCSWRGIVCDNITGSVITVDLRNPYGNDLYSPRHRFWNLSGEIRPSLMNLKSLTHLDLSFNTFGYVPIPEFIGSLQNLMYLNLSNAEFSDLIPPNLGNLSNLQFLDVSSSVGLSSLKVSNFEWITGLGSLKHLGMNGVNLSSVDANWLEILITLPRLKQLHLHECNLSGSISSITSVNFSSLSLIDLSSNLFSSMFPKWLVNVTSLEYVDLSSSLLRGRIPLEFAELPRLRFLNLGENGNLTADAFSLFNGTWKIIEVLDLASNKIHGKIPSNLGNMTSLTNLKLSNNMIQGGIPSYIGSLCNLVNIDLSGNMMTGTLPQFLKGTEKCGTKTPLPSLVWLRLSDNQLRGTLPDWLGHAYNLEELSLSFNSFEGPLPPSFGSLQNLDRLRLAVNRLNGTLPQSIIGELSNLTLLDVSSNFMTGILSESHFSKLSKLKVLQLSSNSFVLDVHYDWVPPFQIHYLGMGDCQLGPMFPQWLKSQNEIMSLDFSNASLSGPIPNWFWDLSSSLSLINVSLNKIPGELPKWLDVYPFADVDLSWNLFEGDIPLPSVEVELFDLSNNRFSGPILRNVSNVMPNLIFFSLSNNQLTGEIPTDIGNMSVLQVIDFSGNSLTGSIPISIGKCSLLKALDLTQNSLTGEIPESVGQLSQLQSLHINENSISGKFPSSLQNLSSLETLDLGNNELHDSLPLWLSKGFTLLRIVKLRSNALFGQILFDFSNMISLQVLDLAENSLTGRIPKSLGNLTAMSQVGMTNEYLQYGHYGCVYYEDNLVVNTKNQALKFTKILYLVTAIDLSCNRFFGDIPIELTKLRSLGTLNLSRNHISGRITNEISSLRQLTSLDLSSNDLSGAIPPSLASLSFLAYLNLSDNHLSGRIPMGGQMSTFGASSFVENTGLCGAPLVNCREGSGQGDSSQNKDGLAADIWLYISIGLGFGTGIIVPYYVLIIKNPWRDWYFDILDKVVFKLLKK